MKQSRMHLKITSIIVLVFAAFSFLNILSELVLGALNDATIPEGSPDNILLITKVFLLVVTLIMLAPQIYIGIKGIKVANKPNSSKAHIVWAIILLAFSVSCLVSPIAAIAANEDIFSNVFSILSVIVEILIYFDYTRCAIAVSKGK